MAGLKKEKEKAVTEREKNEDSTLLSCTLLVAIYS